MNVPEPVSQATKWALVVGLAFFSADSACALIQRKLSVAPKPLPVTVAGAVQPNLPAQAAPQGLVALMKTTKPEGVVAIGGNPAGPGRPGAPNTRPQPARPPANLQLRGTMAGLNGNGLAMIDVNGQTQVVGTGEKVGGMTVVSVTAYTVELDFNGQKQILEMDSSGPVAAATQPVVAASQLNPQQPNPSPTPDLSATPGAGDAILSQHELRAILDNPQAFAGQGFRMKPVLNGGEIVGMRVAIPNSSHPLARLGIKDGDVVKSLNGTPINGPEALSSIYRTLRNTPNLSFEVERNGIPQTVEITLEE